MKRTMLTTIIIFSTLMILVSCTADEYKTAMHSIDDKSYEEALSILNNIPSDYKDTEKLKKICHNNIDYNTALENYHNGDYQKALEHINKVDNNFKDVDMIVNNINFEQNKMKEEKELLQNYIDKIDPSWYLSTSLSQNNDYKNKENIKNLYNITKLYEDVVLQLNTKETDDWNINLMEASNILKLYFKSTELINKVRLGYYNPYGQSIIEQTLKETSPIYSEFYLQSDCSFLYTVGHLMYNDISQINESALIDFVNNKRRSSQYFTEAELQTYSEILEETFLNLSKMGITDNIWNLAYTKQADLSIYQTGVAKIGMSKDQVYFTMGIPKDINTTESLYTVRKQLVYYSSYVYLENNKVISVQH